MHVVENKLRKGSDIVMEAKDNIELVNEIREETCEVASTLADTRTGQKSKRKDLLASYKDDIEVSILSSTLDDKNLHLIDIISGS